LEDKLILRRRVLIGFYSFNHRRAYVPAPQNGEHPWFHLLGLISFFYLICFYPGEALVLDTIKSYKSFAFTYYFRSRPLNREGNFQGFVNLLEKREERKGVIKDLSGNRIKSLRLLASGDWEYKKNKIWEKRLRGEDSDIMRVIELILSASLPQFGDTLFTPNSFFLDPITSLGSAKGQITYRKGKVGEIIVSDTIRDVYLRIRFSNYNRPKKIKIPLRPKVRIIFALPEKQGPEHKKMRETTFACLRQRLECLNIHYELKLGRKKHILDLAEEIEDEMLDLLFALGRCSLYLGKTEGSFPLAPLTRVGNAIFFHLADSIGEALSLRTGGIKTDLLLGIDNKIFFPLTVDKLGEGGKIEVLKMEVWDKRRELVFSVLKDPLPQPIIILRVRRL